MDTNGGEVVKFEFDPTVPAAHWTSDQTHRRRPATHGRDRASAVGVRLSPRRPRRRRRHAGRAPIFQYIGADITTGTVDLLVGVQPELPRRHACGRSPPSRGATSTTTTTGSSVYNLDNEAGNWVVVTEDTADYSPRRGTSIGGLSPGDLRDRRARGRPATAVDESHYIKLARTEQQAIDAYAWEAAIDTGVNPYVIDLTPATTTNTRSFDADDIDDDTITLRRGRQHVRARPGGRSTASRAGPTHDRVVEDADGDLCWRSPNADDRRHAVRPADRGPRARRPRTT